MNQYFQNDQNMLQNLAWIKDPFIAQDRSVILMKQYKMFIDTVPNFTLQLNFKKLPFVEFGYSIKK